MMRLFRSELLRARSRRLVWVVLIGGVVATVIALTGLALNSSPPTEIAVQQAQANYDRAVARCMQGHTFGPDGGYPPAYESLEEACRDTSDPSLSVRGAWLHDLPDVLLGISMFVILLGAWLGASLAGADWTNSTMTTLLTWEPRRTRVLLVRAVVVVLVIVVLTVVLQAVFAGLFALAAAGFGSTALTGSDVWGEAARTIVRVCAMAAVIGLVAYAVAMIGRSTVASLGVLFGYLVLFEGVFAGFWPKIEPRLLVRAMGVVLSQTPLESLEVTPGPGLAAPVVPHVVLSVAGAWVLIAVYVVVLLGLSGIAFRRRDVS